MRNRFVGVCIRCGVQVLAGQGHFERTNNQHHQHLRSQYRPGGRWACRCLRCVGQGNAPPTADELVKRLKPLQGAQDGPDV